MKRRHALLVLLCVASFFSCTRINDQLKKRSISDEGPALGITSSDSTDLEPKTYSQDLPMNDLMAMLADKGKGFYLEGPDGHYQGSLVFSKSGVDFFLDTSGIIGNAEIEKKTDSLIEIDTLVYFIGAEEIEPDAKVSVWKYAVEIEKRKLFELLEHTDDAIGLSMIKTYPPIELNIKQHGWNKLFIVAHDIDAIPSIADGAITVDSFVVHAGESVEVVNLDFENSYTSDSMMAKIRINNLKGWIPVTNLKDFL